MPMKASNTRKTREPTSRHIAVSQTTYDRLASLGKKGDTFEDILTNLLVNSESSSYVYDTKKGIYLKREGTHDC